jgi:hypothetical protein
MMAIDLDFIYLKGQQTFPFKLPIAKPIPFTHESSRDFERERDGER